MALQYAGVECELREVLLKDKPAAMLALSEKGTVPVLQVHEQVLDESLDVMRWALSAADPDGWLDIEDKAGLVERNDGAFKYYLDRYKYFDRYPEQSQQWYCEQALVFLRDLETRLQPSDGKPGFLYHDTLSWVDVAVFPFVRQFAFVDKQKFDALDLPALHQWLDYFLESELFLKVMTKYFVWTAGDPLTLFPNEPHIST